MTNEGNDKRPKPPYPTFVQVKTEADNKLFEDIYSVVKAAYGSTFVSEVSKNRIRFLMKDDRNVGIGTFEMLPYQPEVETNIELYYPFSTHPAVLAIRENAHVFEIGKLAFVEDKRNIGLISSFVDFIFKIAKQHHIDYFICAMNIEIYRFLVFKHKIVMKKLDKKLDFGEFGTYPVIIDIQESLKRAADTV
ncbi:hypothetical protein [Paenibacillus tyrfis]|uniref:N-acetyltransferase domain-containing protein n=1 Tax=Paenibacillus tyrfis TaxID=1501230 RepID=A0A081NTN3_9BACL|nr:hypothetical protein [Paenibacillus tyrfis]KEQ21806.1 hypothetical protein ET33_30810 [Paenibacillus tyrfis]